MRHESGAEEVERNKRIQNMMMRPSEKGTHNVSTLGGKSEFQTAFQDYLHTES